MIIFLKVHRKGSPGGLSCKMTNGPLVAIDWIVIKPDLIPGELDGWLSVMNSDVIPVSIVEIIVSYFKFKDQHHEKKRQMR
jgi:hypothetical protein